MKLSLLVLSEGKACGTKIPVTLSQFVIGRDPQCNLRPASPLISKRHCALLIKAGKVYLRDFGSTNGSFVNDEPVKAERQLKHDDVLKIGPLLFRVVIEATATVDKPTPPPPQVKPPQEVPTGDDESIAAMLLSLQEEGDTDSGGKEAREEDIPSGTTVMEIPTVPPQPAATAPPGEAKEGKEGKDKKEDAKKDKNKPGTTASAAAALLAKYSRRPRG
jgi:pSer/pThr/pTyr-binding forkhead associated (FHA) protein